MHKNSLTSPLYTIFSFNAIGVEQFGLVPNVVYLTYFLLYLYKKEFFLSKYMKK